MKLAILIDSLIRGGAERQALNSAWELSRAGVDVELIHYYSDDEVGDTYDHPARDAGLVTLLPKQGKTLPFVSALRRHLKQGRFDVLHGFKGTVSLYGAVAGRWAGVPVVLGGYRNRYHDPPRIRRLHKLVNRALDGWVVNSKAIVDSLADAFGADPKRCHVVYNGVDTDRLVSDLSAAHAKLKFKVDPGAPVVSIVASLTSQKNHEMFLRVAAGLLTQRPEMEFLVAGDGDLRHDLLARAASLGLSDRVHFLGLRSDVPDLFRASDISVLTSDYEGVPNALLEAMHMEVPVVVTRYAGVEEVITDGRDGVVVPLNDADAMIRQIGHLLDDKDQRAQLGSAARQTVTDRFSMRAMVKALTDTYEDCLSRKRRRNGAA